MSENYIPKTPNFPYWQTLRVMYPPRDAAKYMTRAMSAHLHDVVDEINRIRVEGVDGVDGGLTEADIADIPKLWTYEYTATSIGEYVIEMPRLFKDNPFQLFREKRAEHSSGYYFSGPGGANKNIHLYKPLQYDDELDPKGETVRVIYAEA